MKKILIAIISSVFVVMFNAIGNAEEVEGLSEKIDALMMENNFTQEQIEEMDRQYIEDFNDRFWNEYLEHTKILGKMHTDSDEEEYEYCLNRERPNYLYGILLTPLKSRNYKQQYAQESIFDYLFCGTEQYWATICNNGYGTAAAFSKKGNYLYNHEQITISKDMIEFLKNKDDLQNMLIEKGEDRVDELKICAINYRWTILYIRCNENEYSVVLYYSDGSDKKHQIELEKYKLYTVQEMFDIVENQRKEDLKDYYTLPKTKPIYTTEAESLQADGLLNGNEKGLDLLKPLTRIEATAILVRAMGLEDTPTSDTSYFADIQSDNWGAKYANIAKDKGIADGIGDNLFAPNDTITASQFATLILRNQGENPDWQTAINTFAERGLITSEQAKKMDLFTRGDMAKIIYEAKQRNMF